MSPEPGPYAESCAICTSAWEVVRLIPCCQLCLHVNAPFVTRPLTWVDDAGTQQLCMAAVSGSAVNLGQHFARESHTPASTFTDRIFHTLLFSSIFFL